MDQTKALAAFSALSQSTRLQVFRLLIKAGHKGLLAGDIANQLNVRQNTMSTNLSILTQAGLLQSEREGRAIRYRADMTGVQHLLDFLLLDCCGGNAEECKPLVQALCCPD